MVLGGAQKEVFLLFFDCSNAAVLTGKLLLTVAFAFDAIPTIIATIETHCVNI